MEGFESTKYLSEISRLSNYLEQEGVDVNDTEAVVAAAKTLFDESHPEHEVEEIIHAFFEDQSNDLE